MGVDLIQFFTVQRSIFGSCPVCREFFRLSDLRLVHRRRSDWMHELEVEESRLDDAEERLAVAERSLREAARKAGRAQARRLIRKLDPVFTPRGLAPEDAKTLFHPVDYAVFSGLSERDAVKGIHLLDRKVKRGEEQGIQRSIERAIGQGRYEWITFRVDNAGQVTQED
jgi:predicted Holliday junction resolvase-like endonuclease